MPTTASYQTQNSYDELKYRPYELDYSSILKEASAKTSYWMEGAAKIQQAYSKITGLNPQFKQNKEALNSFNSQVKDQIKKLAGTDLGIQGNANQINNIIAPLYDTTNNTSKAIILDDSYNKAGQSLMKEIEGYKTKDKGIHYSQDNEEYAMGWYKKYMLKSKDPNASLKDLEELRGEIKGYTPYYDVLPTIKDAIAKCPENKTSVQYVKTGSNGGATGYLEKDEFTSKNSVGCIQSMLSMDPKAQQQFAISGYVRYGKDYVALGKDYREQALERNSYVQKEIGTLKSQATKIGITPEEKQAIDDQIRALQSDFDESKEHIGKIDVGDFSFIKEGYDRFATSVYTRNKIKDFSSFNKNPNDNKIISLTSDMTFITGQKMQNDNNQKALDRQLDIETNLQNQRFQHDENRLKNTDNINLEILKGTIKGTKLDANGNPIGGLNEEFRYENNLEGEIGSKVVQTESTFKAEGDALLKKKAFLGGELRTILNNVFKQNLTQEETAAFITDLKKDPVRMAKLNAESSTWGNIISEIDQLKFDESLHNSQKLRIESQIANELQPIINEKIIIKTNKGDFSVYKKDIGKYVTETKPPTITNSKFNINTPYYYQAFYSDVNNNKLVILNTDEINNVKNKITGIRNKYYSNTKTLTDQQMSSNFLNNDKENPFRNNIYNQLSSYMYKDGNTSKSLITKLDDIRTGYISEKDQTIEVMIPTPEGEDKNIIKTIGTNDRKVSYKGNGIYEVKFADMKNFPAKIDMNTSMNSKLATIIENIEASNTVQGTQVDIGEYKGYKIHVNKGTVGAIWVTSPKGNTQSYDNVAQVIATITRTNPEINAR